MQELISAFLQLAQDICKTYRWQVVSVQDNRVEVMVPFPDGENRRMWVECALQNDLVRIACVFEEEHPQNDYIRARFEEALDRKANEAEGKQSLLSTFLPSKDFWVTPLLLSSNILVFVAMVLMGADIFSPDGEIMLKWGALHKPLVEAGGYWRLFACMFLHFGIMHLAVNMYSLFSLGFFLEKLVGKGRFLFAYLASGLLSSANSLYWGSADSSSAGASGAIFGIFGMLLALVTSDLIAKQVRDSILKSLGMLVVINVAIALGGGVDNAGHLGGLFAGAGIGFAYIIAIKKPRFNLPIIGGIAVLYSLLGAFLVFVSMDGSGDYMKNMDEVYKNEEKAVEFYKMPSNIAPEKLLEKVGEGEKLWQKNLQILDSSLKMRLSSRNRKRTELLKKYTLKRLESAQLVRAFVQTNDPKIAQKLEKCAAESKKMIEELNNPKK